MHAYIPTYLRTYHTVAYMRTVADTCDQQDSLASEVAWLKWKEANPPRQAGEVTYGPTIFGDDMGVLYIRVPYRVRHTVHASSPYKLQHRPVRGGPSLVGTRTLFVVAFMFVHPDDNMRTCAGNQNGGGERGQGARASGTVP